MARRANLSSGRHPDDSIFWPQFISVGEFQMVRGVVITQVSNLFLIITAD